MPYELDTYSAKEKQVKQLKDYLFYTRVKIVSQADLLLIDIRA
jgi:hypothetical protein